MPFKDREQQKAYAREWYRKNREARLLSRQERVAQWKAEGRCWYCGKDRDDEFESCTSCRFLRQRIKSSKLPKTEQPEPKEHKKNTAYHAKLWYEKQRDLVLNHYGNKCVCCGETCARFLTIDHIHNNGSEHRKVDPKAKSIYRWLVLANYPEGFQVMCYNCNMGRYRNGGVCPHVEKL